MVNVDLNKHFIALIPARGGSKGVKRKNIRLLNGKPLLAYTAEAAISSKYISRTFLSSDDEEILQLGKNLGLELIVRPENLSSDKSTANEVIAHFVKASPDEFLENTFLVYLQPTSPLRNGYHIDSAIEVLLGKNEGSVVSVTLLEKNPYKAYLIDQHGHLYPLMGEKYLNMNRQDLPDVYIPNGAIYIFSLSEFLRTGMIPTNKSLPFVMDSDVSRDIDTEKDLIEAELFLKEKNNG